MKQKILMLVVCGLSFFSEVGRATIVIPAEWEGPHLGPSDPHYLELQQSRDEGPPLSDINDRRDEPKVTDRADRAEPKDPGAVAMPEPSTRTMALIGAVAAGLSLLRRKK